MITCLRKSYQEPRKGRKLFLHFQEKNVPVKQKKHPVTGENREKKPGTE